MIAILCYNYCFLYYYLELGLVIFKMFSWFKKDKNNATKEVEYLPPADIDNKKYSMEVTDERFEELLDYAYYQLPSHILKQLKNVTIIVDPDYNPKLYGLYQGVPLTKRVNNHSKLPDVITIYRETIKRHTTNEAQLYEQTRKTLFHEIGHFLGLGHDKLHKYGY